MYGAVMIQVDVTEFEARLDTMEAVLGDIKAGVVISLKQKLMSDRRLLATTQDGDPVVNENGIVVDWSPAIRNVVLGEIAEVSALIATLTA